MILNFVKNIFINYSIVVAGFVLTPYLIAWILKVIADGVKNLLARIGGERALYTFGQPGVFIHECSHLAMDLLFGHHISGMKLFASKPDEEGRLGYVNSQYDRNNIYQSIGCFFTGIAPIFGGLITIIGTLMLTCHIRFGQFVDLIRDHVTTDNTMDSIIATTKALFNLCYTSFNETSFMYKTIFMLVTAVVSLTIFSLSNADMKTASVGLFPLAVFFMPVGVIVYLIFGNHMIMAITTLSIAFWLLVSVIALFGMFLGIDLLEVYIFGKKSYKIIRDRFKPVKGE